MNTLKYIAAIVATVALCGCASGPSAPGDYAVFFANDKADIDADASKTIRQAAETFRTGNYTSVAVIGHTDTTGPRSHNMDLSKRRADATRAELVRDGVPMDKIVSTGSGEAGNYVQTQNNAAEGQNRRVVIDLR